MRNLLVALITLACFAVTAGADQIGFSSVEGYSVGALHGQPSSGGTWSCTTNATNVFKVYQSGSSPHEDRLDIQLSDHSNPPVADYATKRMIPVTGDFFAAYSFYMSLYADDADDETDIALGQSSDSGWGPYLGLNKLNGNTMAYHDGSGWTNLPVTVAERKWYDVEITGNVTTGKYDLSLYQEDLRVPGDPTSGRLILKYGLDFRDSPTELAYVMLTNDGSSEDGGDYEHRYDDLILTPEPTSLCVLGIGAMALIRRRRRK